MYGLKPEDIKHLQLLRGEPVSQVAVGEYQVQFNTGGTRIYGVSVEGRCELIDPSGTIADVWERGRRSKEFRFLEVLGKTIADVRIDSPKSFVATLEDGWSLRFVDDSEQYESFSVGNMYV